jgi:hypothetical protein
MNSMSGIHRSSSQNGCGAVLSIQTANNGKLQVVFLNTQVVWIAVIQRGQPKNLKEPST